MASDDAGDAKGSRSTVVRLKLRYKSATAEQFIEKYGADVSPRGIYANIAKPLAVGTLVKLEIRLDDEQMIIKGAGSVVLNRDRAQAGGARRAGLWIKFIQIDEASKAFIEKLVSARADAGRAYEEHEDKEEKEEKEEKDAKEAMEAEDVTVVGSPLQSHQEGPALPVPAAPRFRGTLVGITAPVALPARPLASLPPIPTPPPPKAASLPPPPVPAARRLRATLVGITAPPMLAPRTSVASLPPIPTPPPKVRSAPPPPGRALEERGETDAEDATVVWDEAPAASGQEATLIEVPAPASLPDRPRPASLPPIPTPPPPKARSALPRPVVAYVEPSEKDAEDDTVIWDHEPSHREAPALPVPQAPPTPGADSVAATAQEDAARVARLKATVIRKRPPLPSPRESHPWLRAGAWVALGFFATVVLALSVRSTDWFRALTTLAAGPASTGGGTTSAPATMTSAETAPVAEAPADAAPAAAAPAPAPPAGATPAAEMADATPMMSSSGAIDLPVPPPSPKPAPVPRSPAPGTRVASPGATDIPTVRTKPKPKPAPTIDDGF